jgi:NAD(P)-dependent dehydrogenase (short-subunit alcohol dehydrogenase family)
VVNTSNITDYSDAENAVKQAVDTFGGLHVVVNNAGICRDRMFASMTEAEWDAVISVHLKGHFCISSHAVHYWRDQSKQGNKVDARIINTSSGAGLNGSVGQSNYAAAKAGIAALTLNQAAELGRYGITANCLAPAGRTGMTEQVFGDMMKKPDDGSFDYYDPANVAPLVVWLGSEASRPVTGRVFEVEGDKIAIADGWRSTAGVRKGARWEPEEISAAMDSLLSREVPAQKVYGT